MITDYNLNPDLINQIDQELKEKIGVAVNHTPYLTEKFGGLIMEEVNA